MLCSHIHWTCFILNIELFYELLYIWAAWQNQQNGVCAQWRLGSTQFDQESSLSAWRKLGSLATHLAHSKDTDQTGRMLGTHVILLVLSWGGSFDFCLSDDASSLQALCCQTVQFTDLFRWIITVVLNFENEFLETIYNLIGRQNIFVTIICNKFFVLCSA